MEDPPICPIHNVSMHEEVSEIPVEHEDGSYVFDSQGNVVTEKWSTLVCDICEAEDER